MDLQPAPALKMDAQPDVITGGPDATYTLRVANEGNTIVAVSLTGTDQERKVSFAFRPRSVQIAPNSTAPATVTVKARAPWTGQEVRRTLTVKASAPPDLAAERNITFVQRPLVLFDAPRETAHGLENRSWNQQTRISHQWSRGPSSAFRLWRCTG